jgi:hypothetical protein
VKQWRHLWNLIPLLKQEWKEVCSVSGFKLFNIFLLFTLSDSGVAESIGHLHPFVFCRTKPVRGILVNLSQVTANLRRKDQITTIGK